jgi:hypothetical protein
VREGESNEKHIKAEEGSAEAALIPPFSRGRKLQKGE